MNHRLLGIVLCGGRSTRMGRDKAVLLHPSGGTFASHALERLQGICDHVCGSGKSNYPQDVEVIEDPAPFQGPVVGVAAALAYAHEHSYDACLVTPVDMPFLTRDDLSKLHECWRQNPTEICCAISSDDNRIQPLVAVYPVSFRSCLGDLAESKDRSLSRWIARQTYLKITLSAESCRNINSPDDLADHTL